MAIFHCYVSSPEGKEHVPNLPFSPFFAVHLGFHFFMVFSVALSRLERYSKDTADFSKQGLTWINDQPDSDGDSWTVVVGQTLLTDLQLG